LLIHRPPKSWLNYLACLAGVTVKILWVEEAPPRFLVVDEAVAITDLVEDHPKQLF